MHLLVTRPEPDASELKAQLEAAGHRVSVEPLIEIEPVSLGELALGRAQGLIVTSRNALRALADDPRLEEARRLPLFAVGPQTRELALALGFTRVIMGAGSARELMPLIAAEVDPAGGPLVHLSGDRVAFDLEQALDGHGLVVVRAVVYQSIAAASFGSATIAAIESGMIDGVILMSPRTAETYVRLVEAHNLAAGAKRIAHLCLSQAVANRLGPLRAERVDIATEANSEQMLALVSRIAPQLAPRSP